MILISENIILNDKLSYYNEKLTFLKKNHYQMVTRQLAPKPTRPRTSRPENLDKSPQICWTTRPNRKTTRPNFVSYI